MMDGTPSEISLDDGVSLVKATRSITDHEPTHTTLYFLYEALTILSTSNDFIPKTKGTEKM